VSIGHFLKTGNNPVSGFSNEIILHYSGWKYRDEMSPYGEDNETEALPGEGYPAWYTVNIASHYRISERFEIQVSIENLFDRFYKTFASGTAAPGRNFILTLRAAI
jgi:hemoglobin/transferrin/lactoferrin receptor protein